MISTRNKVFILLALCMLALIFVPGLPEECAKLITDGVAYLSQKVSITLK